jgi:predicted amidohydrolase YtcJ
MIRENLLPEIVGLGVMQGLGSNRLRVGPIKMFIDGSLIGRTAAVTQPFVNDPRPDYLGLTMMSQEELDEYVMQAHRAGFQIAIHAIGDRGIDMVLDAYEKALTASPRADHRHRIEHCGICRPDIIERIVRLGVVPVTQPVFILEYGDGFIRHLGLERIQLTYPFRSFLERGVKLVFSSDCPVSAFAPLKSVQAAVTERTGSGASYALEEAVTVEDRVEALRRTNDAYVRAGITSSQDASSDSADDIKAYQQAVKQGHLKLRTSMMIRENLLPQLVELGIEQGFGDHRLRVGPIKMFIDGSLIGRTAAVTEPFLDDPRPDNLGLMMMPKEQFEDYVMQAHAAGYQIAVHAIGDRGIDWVLDAYEKALTIMPRRDHRHRIEHCGICRPDILDRIQRLGVIPVSQPVFIIEYGDGFIRHLGPWRSQLTYPFRSFLERGIRLVFSSDCPVSDFAPLKSIQAAVTERTGSGQSYALEEAVTVEEALEMYTVAGAYATFEEDIKGQLKAGMLADVTILERDPRTVDPMALTDLKVSATIIGGETVYEG